MVRSRALIKAAVNGRRRSAEPSNPQARRIALGFTQERLNENHRTTTPKLRPLTRNWFGRLGNLRQVFEKFAKGLGGLVVGSQRVYKWDDAVAPAMPPLTAKELHPLLLFYAVSTKPTKSQHTRIRRETVQNFWLTAICKSYRLIKGTPLPRSIVDQGLKYIDKITHQLQLRTLPDPRAELTLESCVSLIDSCFTPHWQQAWRSRLDTALFAALHAQTGMRSCGTLTNLYRVAKDSAYVPELSSNADSVLRYNQAGQDGIYEGIQWKHFTFWITDAGPVVYVKSQDRKTHCSTGQNFPLTSAPIIAMSPNYLALLAAYKDGLFGSTKLEVLLDPKFLKGASRTLLVQKPDR